LFFNDLGRRAGEWKPDVGHGNNDLRFFFSGGHYNRKEAEKKRAYYDERGKFAVDEQGSNTTGKAVGNSMRRRFRMFGAQCIKPKTAHRSLQAHTEADLPHL